MTVGYGRGDICLEGGLGRPSSEGGRLMGGKPGCDGQPLPREELVKLATAPSIPSWSQLAPALVALAGDNSPDALAGILQRLERAEGGAW